MAILSWRDRCAVAKTRQEEKGEEPWEKGKEEKVKLEMGRSWDEMSWAELEVELEKVVWFQLQLARHNITHSIALLLAKDDLFTARLALLHMFYIGSSDSAIQTKPNSTFFSHVGPTNRPHCSSATAIHYCVEFGGYWVLCNYCTSHLTFPNQNIFHTEKKIFLVKHLNGSV